VAGTFSSVLAASMGACLVEKHFTLARAEKKGDYQVSLEPPELAKMVAEIRSIDVLKGSCVKKVYEPEIKWRKNARKSLVAAKDLKAGERLTMENIKIIRPGTGIHPKHLPMVLGRQIKKDLKENQLLAIDDI
jgi:sialic acid synthase SpsE